MFVAFLYSLSIVAVFCGISGIYLNVIKEQDITWIVVDVFWGMNDIYLNVIKEKDININSSGCVLRYEWYLI